MNDETTGALAGGSTLADVQVASGRHPVQKQTRGAGLLRLE